MLASTHRLSMQTFRPLLAFLTVLAFTTVFPCQLPAQVYTRALNARIVNGSQTDEFESVGIVGSMQLGGYCSGTLISPRHVLTAAHCAEETTGDTDGTFIVDGQLYTTSRIFIHPAYDDRNLDNDIAIYELSEEVPGIEPSSIYRDVPEVGDLLEIVGFGGVGNGEDGGDNSFGVKNVGLVMIDAVTETLVTWEFDSPDESNTAPGDSGGPGFLEVDGENFVLSITSGGTNADGAFGDMAFNTRVDAFADWVDDVIEGNDIIGDPTEEEPAEDEVEEEESGCINGGGGGNGNGIRNGNRFIDALFEAIDSWFVQEFDQTFGEWLGDVFGDDDDESDVEDEITEETVETGVAEGGRVRSRARRRTGGRRR